MARTKMIGWLAILLVTMLPGRALANNRAEEAKVMVDGYQFSLVFAEQVKAGDNPLHIRILDGRGMPISGGRIEVSVMPVKGAQDHQENMDSDAHTMEGMQGMSHALSTLPVHDMAGMGRATPALVLSSEQFRKTGDYFGVITFSAAGHWLLNAHFSSNGQTLDADFPVNVVASHSASFAILAGFVGLNALVIWAASVTRRNLAFV